MHNPLLSQSHLMKHEKLMQIHPNRASPDEKIYKRYTGSEEVVPLLNITIPKDMYAFTHSSAASPGTTYYIIQPGNSTTLPCLARYGQPMQARARQRKTQPHPLLIRPIP